MFKSTKIVATVGPASSSKEILLKLAEIGVNVFRLNFSHGTHEEHKARIDLIREIEKETNNILGVLIDLQGPKIRLGEIDGQIQMKKGEEVVIKLEGENIEGIPVQYDFFNFIKPKDKIYIN